MTEQIPQTRFPVQVYRPNGSHDGDACIVVTRYDADAVPKVNQEIAHIDDLARRGNPDAALMPKATDMIAVHDIDSQSFHSIHVHRLDYRPRPAPAVDNVVVFSEPPHAPCRAKKLQLATPGYYRARKDLKPGIHDRDDGTLTKDGTRWASSIMGGPVNARLSFVSSGEPWVYCASHYRADSELRRLRSKFKAEHGYSAATRIDDPDVFAAWLGVDFALGFGKTADVSLDSHEEMAYARSSYRTNLWEGSHPIDSVVHVYHGPVNYEDITGSVDRQKHWLDPNAGPMAWFTKKTSFVNQSEYRFAVTTPGTPKRLIHKIAVSPELRALTCGLV